MRTGTISITSLLLLLFCTNMSEAARVTVKGVHICCGACVVGVEEALEDVEGVTKVAPDRNSKTVTFSATDGKAAQNGINALAKAGFHGSAVHGEKRINFPPSGAKKGEKADKITFTGLHLCCKQCVTGAQKALENVKGAATIEFDSKTKEARVIGKDIDVAAAVAALNKGGFHGTIKRDK